MKWKVEDTPERAAFRSEFRDWLRAVLPDGWMHAVDTDDGDAFDAAKQGWNFFSWAPTIGASGYGAPLWPEEYGGLGGEPWMQQVIREELRQYRLPLIGINLLGVGLAGPTIIEHGTEEQKERHLRKILTAEEIWCQLFSEPGSGSDLAGLATRAERDGDEWVVNGQKVWTTIAQFARWAMLIARTDPEKPKHDGITYFICDMRAPGVEVRPLKQMTGTAEFNEVYLTDVRIPDSQRVGAVGDGWRVARTTLMNERLTLSGVSADPSSIMGASRRDPWQTFLAGIPDTSDPVVRQAVAQAYIDQEVREITAFRANAARLSGYQPGPEAAIGKVFNAESNKRRSALSVNLAGPAAVAWRPGDEEAATISRTFLRARANSIEGGTTEILKSQIAERVLGLPRDADMPKETPWKDIPRN